MTHRQVRCPACRTTFQAEDDPAVAGFTCPKCGARSKRARAVTTPTSAPPPPTPEPPEVFVPAEGTGRTRRRRALVAAGLGAVVALGAVGGVVLLLRRDKAPTVAKVADPAVSAATGYLDALVKGDAAAAARLGTIDLPPAIRSARSVRRDPAGSREVKGSFAPIAALHAKIDERFTLDPASGRYTPRDALGPAAEVLDTLHAAKAKAEKDGLYAKIASGSPDDLFDAAEGLAKPLAALSETILAPRKLVPTYKALVADATPSLPPAERALADDVADHQSTWDALLKRPFATLKADGRFALDRAEVVATVADTLASAGDPPSTLRLTLTRFRLEGIDTGWRVTAARRDEPGASEPDRSGSGDPTSNGSRHP